MNELKSYTEYAVSTPTADFVIGFDFNYGEDAVNVTVDNVPATEAGYTVVYLNETTIRLSPSVPSGVVRLQRETDIDQTDHAYRAGAKFIAQTMDENFEQLRHSQQEVRDGFVKLADDTYEIIDTLNEVGQSAQTAADAAEVAAQLANNAAAQVNAKVSQAELNLALTPVNASLDLTKRGIANRYDSSLTYNSGDRVVLTNGDIVKSTSDGNTNNPNVNMTGWLNIGNTGEVDSIAEMLAIQNPNDGSRVFAGGFQGDNFTYDSSKSSVNNGHSIFNGWERQVPYLHVSPLQWGADPTGQNDSTAAFQAWSNHLNHITFNSTYPACGLIPTGYYIVSDTIEFYDAGCTIISFGAMIGYVGSKVVDSILKINNAVGFKITGSLTLTGWNADKAQCGLLITASSGSAFQSSGIANHIDIVGVTARNLVCGFQIGEDLQDYDKHVAELHFIGCNTMVCRTAVRNYGSQTESSFDGCTLASGFLKETDISVYHALLDIRGGIVTVNGGSIVNSMLPNTFHNTQGIVVKPAKSTLYSNPYPVVAINASHIELTTQMLSIEHGGVPTNSSAISNVSIQDCKGWMGTLPSEELIRIWDSSYVGKLSIGSSNNFYTSLNRTGKNIICGAPNAILDVSPMAFGENMQQGFGSIVGGILKHPLKLISQTSGLNASLATGKQPLIFTTANNSGDLSRYSIYYTINGNIQFPHKMKSINIKVNIVDSGINVAGDIFIEKNGAIVCYANKNTLFATIDYTDNDVLSTDVYRVCFNKPDAVTLNSGGVSNISISAEC